MSVRIGNSKGLEPPNQTAYQSGDQSARAWSVGFEVRRVARVSAVPGLRKGSRPPCARGPSRKRLPPAYAPVRQWAVSPRLSRSGPADAGRHVAGGAPLKAISSTVRRGRHSFCLMADNPKVGLRSPGPRPGLHELGSYPVSSKSLRHACSALDCSALGFVGADGSPAPRRKVTTSVGFVRSRRGEWGFPSVRAPRSRSRC